MRTVMPERLTLAHAIVQDAAAMALAAFNSRGGIGARAKQPQDFVSEVDERVESSIRERLALDFPGEAVFGEEFGGQLGDSNWIIDPIDGTANFLRGVPLWAVSLGFVQAGQPFAGVVAMPALGLVVGAQAGAGLFVGGQSAQRDAAFDSVRIASVGDAVDDIEAVAATSAALRRAGWVVQAYRSTATAMAFAALGRLDGHVQPRVKAWDMAAGAVLCTEAGLQVRHGSLLQPDTFVAAGTPALQQALPADWAWHGRGKD